MQTQYQYVVGSRVYLAKTVQHRGKKRVSFTNFNAQFLYSINNMYVTLQLQSSLLSSGIVYSHLQRVTIPDAVII
jgi:hypothetical protein